MDPIPDDCPGARHCTIGEVRSRHCGTGGGCDLPYDGPPRKCEKHGDCGAHCEGYGGIWVTGQPFQLNIKCVIIGIMVAGVYLLPKYAGEGNLWMMAFIFSMTYIGISYYDVMYNCRARLLSGQYSITGIFKPQHRSDPGEPNEPPPGKTWAKDQEAAYMRSVNYAHAAIIGPLVMLASAMAIKGKQSSIYPLVFGLGALGFLYHAMRLIWPRDVRP